MTLKRLAVDLSGVDALERNHFKTRWGIDENLYAWAIEKNMHYLDAILKEHRENVFAHLWRGVSN